jgi:hypothetical protein
MTERTATVPLYISTVPDSDFDDDLAMFVGEAPDADVTLVTADNFKEVVPASFGQMQVFVYNTPQDAFVAREAMADMQVGDEMISSKLPCGHGAVLRITNEGAEASIKVIDRRSTPTNIMTEILPIVISSEVSASRFEGLTDEGVMEDVVAKTSRFIASKLARQLGDLDLEVSTSLAFEMENRTGFPKGFVSRSLEDILNGYDRELSDFSEAELDHIDHAISLAVGKCEFSHAFDTIDPEVCNQLERSAPEVYGKLTGDEPEPEDDENADTPAPM